MINNLLDTKAYPHLIAF